MQANVYETDLLVNEYLLFHYGTAEDQLPYAFGPKEALFYPVRCVSEFLPGYEATTWFGLFTTAGTSHEIVLKINSEVASILADASFRVKFLAPQMFEPMASSPEAFADYIKAETRKWGKLIRERHLSIDR